MLDVEGRPPFAVHAENRPDADQGQAVKEEAFLFQIHVPKKRDQTVDHIAGKAVEFVNEQNQRFVEHPFIF